MTRIIKAFGPDGTLFSMLYHELGQETPFHVRFFDKNGEYFEEDLYLNDYKITENKVIVSADGKKNKIFTIRENGMVYISWPKTPLDK